MNRECECELEKEQQRSAERGRETWERLRLLRVRENVRACIQYLPITILVIN